MDLKAVFEKLVKTDDQMKRMEIVENFEMPEQDDEVGEEVADMQATIEDLNAQVEDLQATIQEKDQKYIDTFFNGNEEDTEPKEEKEEKKEEKKSLDDIEKEITKK